MEELKLQGTRTGGPSPYRSKLERAQKWSHSPLSVEPTIRNTGGFFWSLKAHIFCCFKCYRRNSCGEMLPILVVSFLWNYSGQHGWVDQGSVTQRSLFKSNAVKRLPKAPPRINQKCKNLIGIRCNEAAVGSSVKKLTETEEGSKTLLKSAESF